MSRRRRASTRRRAPSSAPATARRPSSSASAARSPSASRPRARVLRALLSRWPNTPQVELITTDGFLFPNAVLQREGLMERKGFPESYDLPALLRLPLRRSRPASAARLGAGLFASRLRHRAQRDGVTIDAARHPDRRGAQRAAAAAPAARRQARALRLGFLRFLGLYRRRRGPTSIAGTSRRFMSGCAQTAFRDPSSYLPPLCR